MTVKTLAMRAGLVVAVAASLSACASSRMGGGDTVSRGAVNSVSEVDYGTVIDARGVTIQGTRSGTGAVVGAVAGGVAGSQIGHGRKSHVVGGVAGAVVGGLVGDAVEEGVTQQRGVQYTVRMRGGRKIVVTQAADYMIPVGARVQVLYDADGRARIQEAR